MKDTDICLLELEDDLIESGRINNVLLRTICLPEKESVSGSSCLTSGINRDSKIIDAIPLKLFNQSFCESQSDYSFFGETLNEKQLCAGLPTNSKYTLKFSGEHEEDFGGPLICLDKTTKTPVFTGIASSNSLSTRTGHPGMILSEKIKNSPNQRYIYTTTL